MATREELQALISSATPKASPEVTPPTPEFPTILDSGTDSPFGDLSPTAPAGLAVPSFAPSEGDLDVEPVETPPDFGPALLQGTFQLLKATGRSLEISADDPLSEATGTKSIIGHMKEKTGQALREFGIQGLKNHPEIVRPERLRGGVVEMLSNPDTRWDYVQRLLGENLPNVAGSVVAAGAGFVGGGPVGSLLMSQQFSKSLETGNAAEELEHAGASKEDAEQTAKTVGFVNSLLDAAPIGKIMFDIPSLRKAWNNHLSKELIDPIQRNLVTQVLTTGIVEGGTEGLQEIILNFGKTFYNENQDMLEGVDESMFAGLMLGGGTHATAAAVDAVLPSEAERIPDIPEETTEASRKAAEQIMGLQETPRAEGTPLTPESATNDDTAALQLDEAQAVWEQQERSRGALEQFKINVRRADVKMDDAKVDDLSGALDEFGSATKWWNTFNQWITKNPHIQGLNTPLLDGSPGLQQTYELLMGVAHDGEMHAEKRAKELKHLSPKQAKAWGDFMFARTIASDRAETVQKDGTVKVGRRLTPNEEAEIAKEAGLDEVSLDMVEKVDEDFNDNLTRLEEVLFNKMLKQFPQEGPLFEQQRTRLNEEMLRLRNRNFFPLSRFGNFVVTGWADVPTTFEGKRVRKNSKMFEEAYSTEAEANEALEFHRRQNYGQRNTIGIDKRVQKDVNYHGLPSIMLARISDELALTQQQKDQLSQIKEEFSPGQGWRKRLLKRGGIAGYSGDAFRTYMGYQLQFNRFLGKLQFRDQIDAAIDQVNNSADIIARQGGNPIKRRKMVESLKDHRDYVLNPGPEWAMWRSVAFQWYLAWLPEKVVLNLMQIPTVVYPHLTAQYGPVKAAKALTKAAKLVTVDMWMSPEKIDPMLAEALREWTRQGHTDQSFAVEAAAMAETDNLARLAPSGLKGSAQRAWAGLSKAGTFLFAKSELVNRRTAAVAAWMLEMDKSGNPNRAWAAGKRATREGTFVFVHHNRPRFMQGKKSSLFVFWMHIQQHLNFLGQNNKQGWLGLFMIFGVAGINGLPGAESIWEILKFLARQYNKQTGTNDLPEDPEKWVREQYGEMLDYLVDDPEGVIQAVTWDGASKYGFGLPWLGERIGVPMPATDMSASLSLGRIPLLHDVLRGMNAPRGFSTALETSITGGAGAAFGIPLAMAKAATLPDSDPWNTFSRIAPRFLAYPAKAYHRLANGGSFYRGGGMIPGTEIDRQNPWHLAEIIAQANGFPSTRENLAKERGYNKREAVNYWTVRKQLILQQLWEVYQGGGAGGKIDPKQKREVLADMNKAKKRYNSTVPFKGMKISDADVRNAVYGRMRDIRLKELGLPRSLRHREIFEDEDGTVFNEENLPGQR